MHARWLRVVAVAGTVLACSDNAALDPDAGLSRTPRTANAEDCPWYDQMPGGWCQSEYQALWDAMDFIQGDSSCDEMRNTLREWLSSGRIYKSIDMSPGVAGRADWDEHKEWPVRFNFMHINANEMWDIDKTLRHEYGHPHQNRDHPDFYTDRYENACYGGSSGGGGVGSPWPPVE